MGGEALRVQVHEDPTRIAAGDWDALVDADPDANVFLRHAYLAALHETGAAVEATGWGPRLLTLWRGERLVAGVPLYAKAHSYGEYVFDWAWAEALERQGRDYYPKWLVAVPFTPVPGSRLLAVDEPARAAAADALLAWTRETGLSSLHVLYAPHAQVEMLAARGLLVRQGVQFHWHNRGFAGFAQFLDALAQPKRKKVRAERRKVTEAGVVLERRTGGDIRDGDLRFFARCYENTYAEHGAPPYLDLAFFRRLAASLPDSLLLVRALRDGEPIASALGIVDRRRRALYGRYWGALAPVSCLHFECCYYQMIEFAIEEGLEVFEGGAQGAHKLARGLDPVATQSAHWIADAGLRAAVARFLERERGALAGSVDELNEHRAWRERAGAAVEGI